MRLTLKLVLLSIAVMLTTNATCQNGPSKPGVLLTWVQSTTPGVTLNNVYRCTGTGCTPAPPAIFTSTAPVTTYTDLTVSASTNYAYAVTATVGTSESAYSAVYPVSIPALPNAPSGLGATAQAKNEMPDSVNLQAKVEWRKK